MTQRHLDNSLPSRDARPTSSASRSLEAVRNRACLPVALTERHRLGRITGNKSRAPHIVGQATAAQELYPYAWGPV